MKKILGGALAATAVGLSAAYGIAQSGTISFAADVPHSDSVTGLIAWVREQSIDQASSDIEIPENLSESGRIRNGAGNYNAMCVQCHLSPGVENSEIRVGLYPIPPNLTIARNTTDDQRSAARNFWIIKHGIKGSGMPAWSKGGMDDSTIWDLVAFLQQAPQLSKSDYEQLVATSAGHAHGGLEADAHQHVQTEMHDAAAHPEQTASSANNAHRSHEHAHGEHQH